MHLVKNPFDAIIDAITEDEDITIEGIASVTGIPVEVVKEVLDEITEDLDLNVIGKLCE